MKAVKLGITGTQRGATIQQLEMIKNILLDEPPTEFHHGCCVGVDYEAHCIAYELDIPIVYHPPIKTVKMADFSSFKGTWRPPKEYLPRNRDIVNETNRLLVVPGEFTEQIRSGTWFTKRYAGENIKPYAIIYPDGTVENS